MLANPVAYTYIYQMECPVEVYWLLSVCERKHEPYHNLLPPHAFFIHKIDNQIYWQIDAVCDTYISDILTFNRLKMFSLFSNWTVYMRLPMQCNHKSLLIWLQFRIAPRITVTLIPLTTSLHICGNKNALIKPFRKADDRRPHCSTYRWQ